MLHTGFVARLLSIPAGETLAARRRFHVRDAASRQRLESIGQMFLYGYHAALGDDHDLLERSLHAVENEQRGFAYEGAAMALTLLDHLVPLRRGRFERFLHGDGEPHMYMLHVGAGWALARLPWLRWRPEAFLSKLDPLLGWLAMDGYGFHQAYFYWPRFVSGQQIPNGLSPYARRAFDQGLGRGMWFVEGADQGRIAAAISSFSKARQPDLWSGAGLACAYAGGCDERAIESLRGGAGPYLPQLAQGAAFAAGARQRAGNPAPHTDLACNIICGLPAADAADLTISLIPRADLDTRAVPAYEVWRQNIQESITRGVLQ